MFGPSPLLVVAIIEECYPDYTKSYLICKFVKTGINLKFNKFTLNLAVETNEHFRIIKFCFGEKIICVGGGGMISEGRK